MPLSSFTVERYRSFVQPTTVEIRPLTLLFGYNSAGKSALARVLPLLKASMGGAVYGPLALDSDMIRDASYSDIRSQLSDRNQLSFGLSWQGGEPTSIHHIEFRLSDRGKDGHVLEKLIGRDGKNRDVLELSDIPGERGRYKIKAKGQKEAIVSIPFSGLKPSIEELGSRQKGALSESGKHLLIECSERLQMIKRSVNWLNAVRASPKRRNRYRGLPDRFEGSGAWAPDVLAHREKDKGDDFLGTVSDWLERMFGHRLYVKALGEDFELLIQPTRDSLARVSIVDVGEGVGQVLSVLVLSELAARGQFGEEPIVVLEQPEMHLHPRAEQALAEWMCGLVQQGSKPRLLIETHSENLLLFVQLAVAQGTLSPDDVQIYWTEMGEDGGSGLWPIPMNKAGKLEGWPHGVFSEDVEMARKLFLARRSG